MLNILARLSSQENDPDGSRVLYYNLAIHIGHPGGLFPTKDHFKLETFLLC